MRLAYVLADIGNYHHARLRALHQAYPSEVTAVEVFAESLFPEFGRGVRNGPYAVVHLALPRSAGRREILSAVYGALDRLSPEVVLVPGWSDREAIAALAWCYRNRARAILLSESNEHDFKRWRIKEWVKRQLVSICAGAAVGGPTHVAYMKALGMAEANVEAGVNIVDNEHFQQGADNARALGRPPNLPARYFLACGRFVDKKNFETLLVAYAQYLSKRPDVLRDLVFAGDGPLRHQLQALASRLGIAARTHFLGYRSYEQLPAIYGNADAFVLPSIVEQWGLVVNEAMAAGLPVLVSRRCGCVADLVVEGVNGFTFDPSDPAELASHLGKLTIAAVQDMGKESRRIISGFGPEHFADTVSALCTNPERHPAPHPGPAVPLVLQLMRLR